MGPRLRAGSAAAAVLWAAAALGVPAARAESGCPAVPPADAAEASSWAPPLDRAVSLRARDLALRDALDRLSASARVPLSYSSDLVPLDRRVCVSARGLPLGAALAAVLAGTGAEPAVVAGQVVLRPARRPSTLPEAPGRASPADRVTALDRIVVTGAPAGAPRRDLTVAMDALDGRALARRDASTLASVLDAAVPGIWAWAQTPGSVTAQYGSVRGASSFGATYPKVYVDGVEAANPLLVSEIDPDAVERVEVIRGPQGAALYGSDAISGVVNIVTRQADTQGGAPGAVLRTRAGAGASAFGTAPRAYDQRASVQGGSNLRSAGLSLGLARSGAVFPGADDRRVSAVGRARWVLPTTVATASVHFSDQRAGVGRNPLLQGLAFSRAPADSSPTSLTTSADPRQAARLYTVSASAIVGGGGRLTHTFLAGVDGYRLDYVPDAATPIPVALDSVLRASRGAGDRTTLRAGTSARLGDAGERLSGTLSAAAEWSVLRQRTEVGQQEERTAVPGQGRGPGLDPRAPRLDARPAEAWYHNTGVLAQASAAYRDAWFATGGLRLEHNDAFARSDRVVALPMAGLAWVRGVGPVQVKLRGAYGRGIRAPHTPARESLRTRDGAAFEGVAPEVQSGTELGAELYAGGSASVQVTRFDQLASGLIQEVAVGVDSVRPGGGGPVRRVRYRLQNVGAIANRGWEMRGGLARGGATLAATLTTVDSRVRRLAAGYGGDLRPGDRMLAVPARTAGLAAGLDRPAWSATLTAARAWSWINYDRLALARDFAAGSVRPEAFTGARLRGYWRAYDGHTDLGATLARRVRPAVWLTAGATNLLGGQLGEPDNLTIRPGRSFTAGVRASF